MKTHPDLFGGETEIVEPEYGKIKKLKNSMGYRKANPGESQCKDCIYFNRKEFHGRTYRKCELIGDSQCDATDIMASGTCRKFTPNV